MTVVRVLQILLVLAPVADRRVRKEYWSDCKCSVRNPSVWRASLRCHVSPYQIATRNVRCPFEPYLHLTNVRLANHSTNTRVVSPLQVNHTDVLRCLTTVSMTNISSPLNREYFLSLDMYWNLFYYKSGVTNWIFKCEKNSKRKKTVIL